MRQVLDVECALGVGVSKTPELLHGVVQRVGSVAGLNGRGTGRDSGRDSGGREGHWRRSRGRCAGVSGVR